MSNNYISRFFLVCILIVGLLLLFSFLSLFMAQQQQQRLRILAIGDSLTAGYYNYGTAFHPYARHLRYRFSTANIPVTIDERGISGEHVVPSMINRLREILTNDSSYDWVIILGGTNDLGYRKSAQKIFKEGLQPMYEMCLNHAPKKIKLVAMTVIENGYNSPTDGSDNDRRKLNTMIRDYVANSKDQDSIYLVDLDKGIPYHSLDGEQQRRIWSDFVHLTPAGYDQMGTLIFDAIKNKL